MRKLATILSIVFLFSVLMSNTSRADAAKPDTITNCTTYAGTMPVVDPPVASKRPIYFDPATCIVKGMRLYKEKATFRAEVKNMHVFASVLGSKREPTMVCGGKKKAYSIDLAYGYEWEMADSGKNAAEKKHYKKWITRYAKTHGCTLYTGDF